jgi:hypothetical protein
VRFLHTCRLKENLKMKRQLPLIGLITLVVACSAGFGQNGPDKKTENKELLTKATLILEQQPFHDKAKDFRGWAMRYVIETDDVSVVICAGPLLEPIMDKKNKYANELLAQYTMGMAVFKLSAPEAAKDENGAQFAGVESAVKAYEAMLKEKPKARFPGMDDLVVKLRNGELKKMVEEAKCGSAKTEPIK